MEKWNDIPGYQGLYQASNLGQIKSLSRPCTIRGRVHLKYERILKPGINSRGYRGLGLWKNEKRISWNVHRLVLMAFVPNNNNLPFINHIDGNKLNNNLDNLEWCTRQHNVDHASKLGLNKKLFGENHPLARLTENDVMGLRQMAKSGYINKDAEGRRLGVSGSVIRNAINGKTWKHIA